MIAADVIPADAVAVIDGVSRHASVRGVITPMLAPITLTLRAGTLVALSGPSGSGKTTLCNILLGWDPPDTGSVRWVTDADPGWTRTSVAPQRLALLDALTVRENVLLPAWAAHRVVPDDELTALATRLDLGELLDRRPTELSFGEQQRAAIARAVLGSPTVVVLDEPTGHQDEARTRAVIDVLSATRDLGACVVVATHDEDVIAAADEVIRLEPPR